MSDQAHGIGQAWVVKITPLENQSPSIPELIVWQSVVTLLSDEIRPTARSTRYLCMPQIANCAIAKRISVTEMEIEIKCFPKQGLDDNLTS